VIARDLGLPELQIAAPADAACCVPYAGLRADLDAAGRTPRVEVSTDQLRHLLMAYDWLRGAR
jgi:hypothetical protein